MIFGLQAKSPVKTLDELNVTEVLPTPYFPSITERKQNNLTGEGLQAGLSTDDKVECFNGRTNLGFGMQRKHRCLVVTARARSFLYHQVGILACSTSLLFLVKYLCQDTNLLQIHCFT